MSEKGCTEMQFSKASVTAPRKTISRVVLMTTARSNNKEEERRKFEELGQAVARQMLEMGVIEASVVGRKLAGRNSRRGKGAVVVLGEALVESGYTVASALVSDDPPTFTLALTSSAKLTTRKRGREAAAEEGEKKEEEEKEEKKEEKEDDAPPAKRPKTPPPTTTTTTKLPSASPGKGSEARSPRKPRFVCHRPFYCPALCCSTKQNRRGCASKCPPTAPPPPPPTTPRKTDNGAAVFAIAADISPRTHAAIMAVQSADVQARFAADEAFARALSGQINGTTAADKKREWLADLRAEKARERDDGLESAMAWERYKEDQRAEREAVEVMTAECEDRWDAELPFLWDHEDTMEAMAEEAKGRASPAEAWGILEEMQKAERLYREEAGRRWREKGLSRVARGKRPEGQVEEKEAEKRDEEKEEEILCAAEPERKKEEEGEEEEEEQEHQEEQAPRPEEGVDAAAPPALVKPVLYQDNKRKRRFVDNLDRAPATATTAAATANAAATAPDYAATGNNKRQRLLGPEQPVAVVAAVTVAAAAAAVAAAASPPPPPPPPPPPSTPCFPPSTAGKVRRTPYSPPRPLAKGAFRPDYVLARPFVRRVGREAAYDNRSRRPADPFQSEVDFPRHYVRARAVRRIAFFERRGASADSDNLFAPKPALLEGRLPSMWTPTAGESDSEGEVDLKTVHKINLERRKEARAAGTAAEVTPPKLFLTKCMPPGVAAMVGVEGAGGTSVAVAGGRRAAGRREREKQRAALNGAGVPVVSRGASRFKTAPVRAGVSTGFVEKRRVKKPAKLASLGLAALAVSIMGSIGSLGAQGGVSSKDAVVWHGSVGVAHGVDGQWSLLQREDVDMGGLAEVAEGGDIEMGGQETSGDEDADTASATVWGNAHPTTSGKTAAPALGSLFLGLSPRCGY
ncbi:uncharacterized protein H6S33_011102 [Morchella sextelata]|uniref:uncharacterized protein n=1 Tax=Morchella sextelata TaxID=1174677 RepID=UPI001D055A7C|nr:uncharacterized protein H6S33_011102 [Morchella sextelata]KAH0611837.1 hypothetical protein H6S33_011102 [Morchella sextelata]